MIRIRSAGIIAVVMLAVAAPALAQQARGAEPVAVFGVGGVRSRAGQRPNALGVLTGVQVRIGGFAKYDQGSCGAAGS